MQHSQLRQRGESVKLFAHKDPQTVQKTLSVLQLKDGLITDITPSYDVDDITSGYYSTEIVCPKDDVYLLILFCGSPIVLRVGDPDLEFVFWADTGMSIPYKHFDEFGTLLESGVLDELRDGWYFKNIPNPTLGFIEVFGTPYIVSVPYCDESIKVSIQVIWSAKVHKRKFGTKTLSQTFNAQTIIQKFNKKTEVLRFNSETKIVGFSVKTIKRTFKRHCN